MKTFWPRGGARDARSANGCLYSLRVHVNLSIRSVVPWWIWLLSAAIYIVTINVNIDLVFSWIDDDRQMEPNIVNVLG